MRYVYVLQSERDPERHYIGSTDDPARRLDEHNSGKSPHTAKFRPWRARASFAFDDPASAATLERYLKSGSGRAFLARHLG